MNVNEGGWGWGMIKNHKIYPRFYMVGGWDSLNRPPLREIRFTSNFYNFSIFVAVTAAFMVSRIGPIVPVPLLMDYFGPIGDQRNEKLKSKPYF